MCLYDCTKSLRDECIMIVFLYYVRVLCMMVVWFSYDFRMTLLCCCLIVLCVCAIVLCIVWDCQIFVYGFCDLCMICGCFRYELCVTFVWCLYAGIMLLWVFVFVCVCMFYFMYCSWFLMCVYAFLGSSSDFRISLFVLKML